MKEFFVEVGKDGGGLWDEKAVIQYFGDEYPKLNNLLEEGNVGDSIAFFSKVFNGLRYTVKRVN